MTSALSYQSRPSMYIRGLIPQNWLRQYGCYMPEEPKLDGRHHSDMEKQSGEDHSVPNIHDGHHCLHFEILQMTF